MLSIALAIAAVFAFIGLLMTIAVLLSDPEDSDRDESDPGHKN